MVSENTNYNLDIPEDNTQERTGDEFGNIKISKLTTMRSKGTPSNLVSKKVQEQANKRMTIKSPLKLVISFKTKF